MRITAQLLRSRAKKPLHSVEYLDLSSLGIERIEKLGTCSKLRTLCLRDNKIDYVSNIYACPQLWNIDLSNNAIQSVEGLSRLVALGSLVLSSNELTWPELLKLRHVHILELSLHGNSQLEQDPYYRIHVIDCLPHVWMLDGRIITSAERLQVEHFFQDSALTDHPVRHKCSKEHFTTTQMKNISVNGVFGEKTIHLMRRFPVNGALNVDTDRRRLQYLAYNLQEDLKLEVKYSKRESHVISESETFLEDVLSIRHQDREKANMLLLLLVASLEFAIPIHLMQETLETTKLSVATNVHTMDLFLLPRDSRCSIVSLLLSAVKVDKDMGEEGGLYDKLYLCLYYSVAELIKLAQSSNKHLPKMDKKSQAVYADSRTLIGAEVVQLMCIVPAFFDYITKDPGVMHLVTTATCDGSIIDRIRRVICKLEKESEEQYICEEIADIILTSIQQNALNMLNRTKSSTPVNGDILLNMKKKALPRRPQSSPIFASEYHAKGRATPRGKGPSSGRKSANLHDSPPPKLGDRVLLGPQNVARIISIPETDIVLVQMDVVPAETGAMVNNSRNPEEHYSYLDMQELYWDHLANYWRPLGTVGDRISIQKLDNSDNSQYLSERQSEPPPQPPNPTSTPPPPTSPRTDGSLLDHQQYIPKPESMPRAVSAQLKERLNLKLQMADETSKTCGQDTGPRGLIQLTGTSPFVLKESENSSVLISDTSKEHVAVSTPGQVAPPTSVVVTVSDAPDPAADLQEKQALEEGPATTNTQGGPQESAFISIDIPQMPYEAESVGGHSSRSGLTQRECAQNERDSFRSAVAKSRESSTKGSNLRGSFTAQTKMGVRPASAADAVGYKMRVANEKHYVSSYQAQRTEAWKNSKLTRPTSSVTVAAPMLRVVSAPPPACPGEDIGSGRKSTISVLRGDSWLAGGRDLHWENLVSRPRTAHTPGWKEGLAPRPKSAAAFRALKRNRSPAIMTPSSMAYDMAYGRGAQQLVPDLVAVDYPPPPMQHGVRSVDNFPMNYMVQPLPPQSMDSSRPLNLQQYTSYGPARSKSRRGPMCECCVSKYGLSIVGDVQQICDHHPTYPLLGTDLPDGPPNPGPSAVTSPRGSADDSERLTVDGLTLKPVFVSVEALDISSANAS